ncbi:D-amino acid dehydrogenase [Caenispirillum salinarum]|uniref:D-amino acid dehydrogenase n=1 Tax=Caenispirillum salinarum TaxID=859058 RepID=UPI00384E3B81
MKVLVLGAGVVGTTAAYYLAKAGHAVTVIDRQPGPGLETSLANGGQISASHVEPWASPATLWKALKWLGDPDAPLVFRWARWDPALWAWLARFLRNCTPGRERLNTERALRIALYSRASLKALREETGISYDERLQGILHVFRSEKDLAEGHHMADQARANGLESRVLDRADMLSTEPALTHVADDLTGAIHFPEDESGDAHLFTVRLAEMAKALGVEFRFGVSVQGLETDRANRRITGVRTDAGVLTADRYVLALGSYSPFVARTAGLKLPVYPAKGYSITVPVAEPGAGNAPGAPTVSVIDGSYKMVYSRLGDRLRCAGTAELAGWDQTLRERRAETIVRHARKLFPKAGDFDHAERWCGLRPKTPDSVPILGRTPWENLVLDTGHGVLGWTMSVGSARVIADLVSGREPEIDIRGLGLDRF